MDTNEFWESLCALRGVETPCARCGGVGVLTYGSTSTWRGGVGGQMITSDVCNRCWGTGDENKRGPSYRLLEAWKAAYDREQAEKQKSEAAE